MKSEDGIQHFCTLINRELLLQGLALHYSLNKNMEKFHLWIYSLDDSVYSLLNNMNLNHVTIVSIKEVEDNTLREAKSSRDRREYLWTLKPACILHVLKSKQSVQSIIFVNADLFFFSSLDDLLKEWEDYSIYVCSQRSSEKNESKTGFYNSGLIAFKNEDAALKCLNWWKEKCIEWCYNIYEDERWSDQKYLNQWPLLFENIKIGTHTGINTGPWNIKNYTIKSKKKKLYCSDRNLVAYRFSGFQIFNESEFNLCTWRNINKKLQKTIYLPYIKTIRKMTRMVKQTDENYLLGFSYMFDTGMIRNYCKYKTKK